MEKSHHKRAYIVVFFDKLEDKVRGHLSRYPIIYAFVGAVGIVLIWKGIWESAEYVPILYGPGSAVLGIVILLMTGLFVSFFIGDSIIISGLKREKKLTEKTEEEIMQAGRTETAEILAKIDHLEKDIHEMNRH